jgi:hypothetical protein
MIRFKTGPVRTVLAAAALAKANQLPLPELLPVGLHFRRRELFRTDQYIEFGTPISLDESMIPSEMVEAVEQGGWVEPPSETVHAIRDQLQSQLPYMTPNVASWEEHRALHLVAHLEARQQNTPLNSWEEEVIAARNVRKAWPGREEVFPPEPLTDARFEAASEAAELLDANGLDGRDLDSSGRRLRKANILSAPLALLKVALFTLLLPVAITSLGLQVALGRVLGDSTDEGLDARTSYQFLAAFFGSLLIWPVVAALCTLVIWLQRVNIGDLLGWTATWLEVSGGSATSGLVLTYLLCFPMFWASGKTFAWAWDAWVDARRAWTRRFMKAEDKSRLLTLLESL